MSKYLVKRNDVYHFRIGIPVDVRPNFRDRNEYHMSLKTSNKKEADIKKLILLKFIKERIKKIREDKLERKSYYKSDDFYDNVSEQIEEINKNRKETYRQIAVLDDNELDTYFNKALIKSQCDTLLAQIEFLLDQIEDNVLRNYAYYIKNKIEAFEVKYSNTAEADFSFNDVRNYYKEIFDFHVDLIKKLKIENAVLGDNDYRGSNAYKEREEIINNIENRKSSKKSLDFNKKRIEDYYKFALKVEGLSKTTVNNKIQVINKFNDFIYESELEINFFNVKEFIKTLENKAHITKKQYMSALNSIYRYLITNDEDFFKKFGENKNPFFGHQFYSANKGQSYSHFTKDEVKKLIKKVEENNDEEMKSCILIAIHAGLRIEEICQLQKKSITKKDNVTCFNIEKSKTKSGIRIIPVHSNILKLVEKLLEASKSGYLIDIETKTEKRSKKLSKRFSRLREQLNFDKSKVFHSLRKTFATELENKKIDPMSLKFLMGHSRRDITHSVYSAGLSVKNMQEYIEMISYE